MRSVRGRVLKRWPGRTRPKGSSISTTISISITSIVTITINITITKDKTQGSSVALSECSSQSDSAISLVCPSPGTCLRVFPEAWTCGLSGQGTRLRPVTTPNTTTTCVPSSFSPRSRTTSEVVVRRASGSYFQQKLLEI